MSNQHQLAAYRPSLAKTDKETTDKFKEAARQAQAAALQTHKEMGRANKMASKLLPRLAKAIATTADVAARCKKNKLIAEMKLGADVVKNLKEAQSDMNRAVAG